MLQITCMSSLLICLIPVVLGDAKCQYYDKDYKVQTVSCIHGCCNEHLYSSPCCTGLPGPQIIGMVAGGLLVITLAVLGIIMLLRSRRNPRHAYNTMTSSPAHDDHIPGHQEAFHQKSPL